MLDLRRREFITLLGGAAAVWPLAARAQQGERMRRIGVLVPFNEHNPEVQALLPAFKQRLHDLGWIESRNIRVDYRFTGDNVERIRAVAGELVAGAPDVIVVWSNVALAVLRQATQAIPIVFVQVSDPVGSGFVASVARPGGNITGFQILKRRSAGNGWKCSGRSRLGSVG